MKRKKDQTEDKMLRYLAQRLESERQAGIPSVPEGLLPEHIGELLREKRPKGFCLVGRSRLAWMAQGGAVLTAAAVLLLCLLPAGQGGNNMGIKQSGQSQDMMMTAVSCGESGAMVTESEIEGAADVTADGKKENMEADKEAFRRSGKAARPDHFIPREYKKK